MQNSCQTPYDLQSYCQTPYVDFIASISDVLCYSSRSEDVAGTAICGVCTGGLEESHSLRCRAACGDSSREVEMSEIAPFGSQGERGARLDRERLHERTRRDQASEQILSGSLPDEDPSGERVGSERMDSHWLSRLLGVSEPCLSNLRWADM